MGWKKKLNKAYRSDMDFKDSPDALSRHFGVASSDKPKKYHDPYKIAGRVVLAGVLVLVIGGPIGLYVRLHTHTINRTYAINRKYHAAEIAEAKASSVQALNHIDYKDGPFEKYAVSDELKNAMNDFAFALHQQFLEKDTYLYSPMTAYLNMDLVSLASTGDVASSMNEVLGEKSVRDSDIKNSILTNFYTGDSGSSHIYQGAFFQDTLTLKEGYVESLTSRNAEAYRLDMDKDLDAICIWANRRIGADMLHTDDLEYQSKANPNPTIAYYLSMLDFEGKWQTTYNNTKTVKDKFTKLDGSTKEMEFMNHEISYRQENWEGETSNAGIYDYGDYISAYDYYQNGYSIQYLTPKKRGEDIFALLSGVNFFVEDRNKILPSYTLDENGKRVYLNLVSFKMPKFKFAMKTDLTKKLKDLGLKGLYENESEALGGGIDFANSGLVGGALSFTKQINTIEFSETGTVAKSIAFSGGYGAAAPGYYAGTYQIDLDEPFVYVIRDPNGLPLFTGAYNG